VYHPDICKDSGEYFAHLTSAYQTLMDDIKRTEYDNDNVYTKDYFTINVFGAKIDTRNVFWLGLLGYGGYVGYQYYQDKYVVKCPLTNSDKNATAILEKKRQSSPSKKLRRCINPTLNICLEFHYLYSIEFLLVALYPKLYIHHKGLHYVIINVLPKQNFHICFEFSVKSQCRENNTYKLRRISKHNANFTIINQVQ